MAEAAPSDTAGKDAAVKAALERLKARCDSLGWINPLIEDYYDFMPRWVGPARAGNDEPKTLRRHVYATPRRE